MSCSTYTASLEALYGLHKSRPSETLVPSADLSLFVVIIVKFCPIDVHHPGTQELDFPASLHVFMRIGTARRRCHRRRSQACTICLPPQSQLKALRDSVQYDLP